MDVAMPTAMPVAPIGQEIGKGAGKDNRLTVFAVIGGAEIDGVFSDALKQGVGDRGQPAFGVAHRRRVIAVDIAEISLAFDQRIADREILCQAHQRVIDRLIAMGMELANDIADQRAHFLKPAAD